MEDFEVVAGRPLPVACRSTPPREPATGDRQRTSDKRAVTLSRCATITLVPYPSDYDFHVVLRDGGLAHIRPIKPSDAPGLDAMFHRMGRDSVYQRFFRHK